MFEGVVGLGKIIGTILAVSSVLLVVITSFEVLRRRHFYLEDCWSEDRLQVMNQNGLLAEGGSSSRETGQSSTILHPTNI